MDKIAVLGPAGTFSDAAAEVYIKEKGERKKDFFDTIDREILLCQFSSIIPNKDILSLIRLCISMGRVNSSLICSQA